MPTYVKDGKRFSTNVGPAQDPEDAARAAGYLSYQDAVEQIGDESRARFELGLDLDPLTRSSDTQVANSDDLAVGRIVALLAGAGAAGFIPGVAAGFGGGGAGAGAGLGAAASAAPAPLAASIGVPAGLPAAALGVPAAASAGTIAPLAASSAIPAGLPSAALGSAPAAASAAPKLLSASQSVPSGLPSASLGTPPKSGFDVSSILGKLSKPSNLDLILNAGAGIGSALVGQSTANRDRALREKELAENARQFDSTLGQRQAEQRLNATQLDPLRQARASQSQALLNALTSNISPVSFSGNRLGGGIGAALTPQALQEITRQTSPDQVRSNIDAFNALAGKLVRS